MTVVYQDNGNGDWDVAASQYGGETEVYAMDGNQTRPRIDGNLVVYQDDSAGNSDVYLLNLDTGDVTPIATTPDPETRPDIHGDSIVWSKGNEIELYTISTAVTETIAFGGFPLENPRIHNGVVVFEDFRTGLSNVTAYVIATGEEFAIGDPDRHAIHGRMAAEAFGDSGQRDRHGRSSGRMVAPKGHGPGVGPGRIT